MLTGKPIFAVALGATGTPSLFSRLDSGEIVVAGENQEGRDLLAEGGGSGFSTYTQILTGVDLTVSSGEVHAVMGPNGAGKSTLSAVIMGRPGYEVLGGTVTLDGVDVLALEPWERAAAGLYLAMQ